MEPPDPADVLEETRRWIAEFLHTEPASITSEEPLANGLLDSIGLLTLASYLEERYGIAVSAADAREGEFDTLHALTEFVVRRAGLA